MNFLVIFSKDWADEFQAEGFNILTPEQVEKLKVSLPTREFWFGTNEGWDEGELEESDFDISELSEGEEATLRKVFPDLAHGYGVGQFPSVDDED